ncbi:MAG: hypothetical protein D6732_23535 [Methanobacteriota archaeon]|nr:MAG: hypothetical protein D6732_23535 [Euryarchaeota archaeon]
MAGAWIDGIGEGKKEYAGVPIIAAAVVGGTTSMITGGKFANGAMTAAFARAYNAEGDHVTIKFVTNSAPAKEAKRIIEKFFEVYKELLERLPRGYTIYITDMMAKEDTYGETPPDKVTQHSATIRLSLKQIMADSETEGFLASIFGHELHHVVWVYENIVTASSPEPLTYKIRIQVERKAFQWQTDKENDFGLSQGESDIIDESFKKQVYLID